MKNFKKILVLLLAIAIPQFIGWLGSIFTRPEIGTWYATLQRPSFAPPNWIFGPVWTILFLLMGVALYLVWQSKGRHKQLAYFIFGAQLAFNFLWSILFFALHNPMLAFLELIVLWFLILFNILVFYRLNKLSAFLLIPYLVWVSFAGFLNAYFWILN